MTEGLRQCMTWLHTWLGLWFCWLLFAVFLTGSLAVFEDPIGHWMTPEHSVAKAREAATISAPVDRRHRLTMAVDFLSREQPAEKMWEIWPANRNWDDGLVVYWRDAEGRYVSRHLDPDTGLQIAEPAVEAGGTKVRETEGGHHFVTFHYNLHAGSAGLWIVAISTIAMLVTLVSGIIIHKRIFKDFFTFRPGKGQRSWLDGHNAVAVLTLPFQFMIAYTGILFYADTYLPAAAKIDGFTQTVPMAPVSALNPMPIPDLEPFARRAEGLMKQKVRAVILDNPGDRSMRIDIYGWNDDRRRDQRISATSGMVSFSARTGAVLRVQQPGGAKGAASLSREVMSGLHMAAFGGWTVKWLYFLCGLAGSAMMGTGAILFMVKRRHRHGNEFGRATANIYRLIERLNVAVIAGLGIASIGFLWSNRLLPTDLIGRGAWELRAFFGLWLMALAHAFLRPAGRAWIEQLGVLAVLCIGLPALNLLTTGDHLAAQIGRSDWESAGVELVVIVFGIGAAWSARKLQRRTGTPQHRRPRNDVIPPIRAAG